MLYEKNIPFEQLPLSDDYMFSRVMRNEKICRILIEKVMNINVAYLEFASAQSDITDKSIGHGSVLDIFVRDDNGNAYDVEMQNRNTGELPMRARYYHSAMDRELLRRGESYKSLRNSVVIFVCTFDIFGKGDAIYSVRSSIMGYNEVVDDGRYTYYLNSKYKNNNTGSEELVNFLDIINNDTDEKLTDFGELVYSTLEDIRSDDVERSCYMTYQMKLDEVREQGIAIGEARGVEKGRDEIIKLMRNIGVSEEIISKIKTEDLKSDIDNKHKS